MLYLFLALIICAQSYSLHAAHQATAQHDLATLYHMLEALNHPSTPPMSPIRLDLLEPYILTAARNEFVPHGVTGPVVISPNAVLTQVVAAWQFMTFDMWAQSNQYTNYQWLIKEHGFITPEQMGWYIHTLVRGQPNRSPVSLEALINAVETPKARRALCDTNVGGGNASCGYQVLKNGLFLGALAYTDPNGYIDIMRQVTDARVALRLFGLANEGTELITNKREHGPWRAVIQQHIKDHPIPGEHEFPDGEWLLQERIAELWQEFSSIEVPESHHTPYHQPRSPQPELFIYNRFLREAQPHKDICKKLQEQDNCQVLFAINPGRHWIMLLASKARGILTFIIADSENESRYQDPDVITIIKDVTHVDINTKLGAIPGLHVINGIKEALTFQKTYHERKPQYAGLGLPENEIEKIVVNEVAALYGVTTKRVETELKKKFG